MPHTVRQRILRAVCTMALLVSAYPVAAQEAPASSARRVTPGSGQVGSAPVGSQDVSAEQTRQDFERVLERYAPAVGRVLKLDPALIDHTHEANPERQTNLNELQIRLNEAMKKLSDAHRMVVTMFDIQGMSHGEIAKVLDTSEGTIRSRLHYAHLQLQSALQDSWEERF